MLVLQKPLLEEVLSDFYRYFDVIEGDQVAPPFMATAHFHSRSEKYVLTKSAKLWAMENNEYVFFGCCDQLDTSQWQDYTNHAIEQGLALIKPHSEHMYSYITLIIIANQVDDVVLSQIKKTKFHKRFKFAIHGWTELRCAVINCEEQSIITNPSGKPMKKTLTRHLKRV